MTENVAASETIKGPQGFPQTRWTLVHMAGDENSSIRQRALSELCTLYWPPVYAYIRSRGNPHQDAQDLTQEFFARFLQREDFDKSDPTRGKLRSYLLGAVGHYLMNADRDKKRLKRGGGAPVLSIDADEAESRCWIPELADEVTPEMIYRRQWATTLLENVISELAATYETKGKKDTFEALRPFISPGGSDTKAAEVAKQLGVSESNLRIMIYRLRQRYAKQLRLAVQDTLAPGEDVESELRELMNSFA